MEIPARREPEADSVWRKRQRHIPGGKPIDFCRETVDNAGRNRRRKSKFRSDGDAGPVIPKRFRIAFLFVPVYMAGTKGRTREHRISGNSGTRL